MPASHLPSRAKAKPERQLRSVAFLVLAVLGTVELVVVMRVIIYRVL
jgi:hypothetical protein